MGFLGFTLLLLPVALPILLVTTFFTDPAQFAEILASLPGLFASLFSGFTGIIFEFIPQKLAEMFPALSDIFTSFM